MTFTEPFATNGVPSNGREILALDREADHRIANNLGLITGLLRMRSRAVTQRPGKMDRAEVGALLDDIAARVEAVGRLHRMLSHSYRHAVIDLGGYLRELCGSLTGTVGLDRPVTFDHAAESCTLPPDQVLTLGLLVSELVTNSVKYAHPTGLPVTIRLRCWQNNDGIVLEFSDDGIGLPEDFDPAMDGGLGFRIVRSLAAQLRASIEFTTNALGTGMRLEIPVTAGATA